MLNNEEEISHRVINRRTILLIELELMPMPQTK